MKKRWMLTTVLAISTCAMLALFASTASANSNPDAEPAIVKTSQDGLTYGYASPFDYGCEPDYIKATATNGKEGYVKKTDLHDAEQQAKTPDEAIRISKEHDDALLAAFTNELSALTGSKGINSDAASKLLSAKLENPSSFPAEAISTIFVGDEEQFTNEQLDHALAQALISISTPIPVYAEDGVTVIGEFLVG